MSQPATSNPVAETIIVQRRKHWINLAPVMIACALLVLLLPVFSYLFGKYHQNLPDIPSSLVALVAMIYVALVALIFFLAIWIYLQNRVVLTNHHLIEYTRRGLFNHSEAQFSLIKLQDVTSRQNGILANMLGYGEIVIQTAGEEDNFIFAQVPRPQELADQIMQAHESLESTAAREAKSV